MEIQTVYDKGLKPVNEDSLLVADPIFGVFDGVSVLEPGAPREDGLTGAAIASRTAKNVFSSRDGALVESALQANDAIRKAMEENGIDWKRKTAQWATTASVIRIGNGSFDWLHIGDSVVMVVMNDGSCRVLGSGHGQDREVLIEWKKLADQGIENIREALSDSMSAARNGEANYGDLDGDPNIERYLEHGTESLENVRHILLFTDGLVMPKEDPASDDDLHRFVDMFEKDTLEGLRDHVRTLEDADPKCWKYPRFKQHDDIAAVAISF
ncbi:MAG TPA: protein phosphatase 2C domain-containing protein [Candidatus Fimivivens sp.]|nr:protein phosphatase 2C domain-containing protein [Candidatus Fimivivens sp.]